MPIVCIQTHIHILVANICQNRRVTNHGQHLINKRFEKKGKKQHWGQEGLWVVLCTRQTSYCGFISQQSSICGLPEKEAFLFENRIESIVVSVTLDLLQRKAAKDIAHVSWSFWRLIIHTSSLCRSLHVNECRQVCAVLNGTIHMKCLALNTCQLVSKILVAMFANFLEVLSESHGDWTNKSSSVWSLVLDMKKLSLLGIEELEPGKRSLDHWGSSSEGNKGVLLGPLAELSGASLILPPLQLPMDEWSFAPIQAPTAVPSMIRSSLESTPMEQKDWLWAVSLKNCERN